MKMQQANNFQYELAQRKALADAIPDPEWLDRMSDIARLIRFRDHVEFRLDKTAYIARHLEWAASDSLNLQKDYRPLSTRDRAGDLEIVEDIAKKTKALKMLLMKRNTYRKDFAAAFFGIDPHFALRHGGDDNYVQLDRREVLLELLQEIVDSAGDVRSYFEGYASKYLSDLGYHPGLNMFVDQALIFWNMWTDTAAGGGRNGGPAARFLCAAVNPWLDFAQKELGITLRRAGALDEQAAGVLIAQRSKRDLSAVKGKTGR
jgi:hypothetical protein